MFRSPPVPWPKVVLVRLRDVLDTGHLFDRTRWHTICNRKQMRLSPADAFMKLDSDRSGSIDHRELTKGLEWLGLRKAVANNTRWAEHIAKIFQVMDADGDGLLSLNDFKGALELDEQDWESVPAASVMRPGMDLPLSSRPPMPTVLQPPGKEPAKLSQRDTRWLPSGRFRFKWQCHGDFGEVWNTQGTLAERKLSIWKPTKLRTKNPDIRGPQVKQRLCFGDVAVAGTKKPAHVGMLEVFDQEESGWFHSGDYSGLEAFLQAVIPHPVRYRKAWSQVASENQLHLWRPIPPSTDFIAIGLVATEADAEPEVTRVHCIPRDWTRQVPAEEFWTDAGTGGQAAKFFVSSFTESKLGAIFEVAAGSSAHSQTPEMHQFKDFTHQVFVEMPKSLRL